MTGIIISFTSGLSRSLISGRGRLLDFGTIGVHLLQGEEEESNQRKRNHHQGEFPSSIVRGDVSLLILRLPYFANPRVVHMLLKVVRSEVLGPLVEVHGGVLAFESGVNRPLRLPPPPHRLHEERLVVGLARLGLGSLLVHHVEHLPVVQALQSGSAQHLVSLHDLLEVSGRLLALVEVRVELLGQAEVGVLDITGGGTGKEAQSLVVFGVPGTAIASGIDQ